MNRRGFLGALLKAGIGAAILPPALTYARKWKATASGVVVPVPVGPRYHTIMLHYKVVGAAPSVLTDNVRCILNGEAVRVSFHE